MAIMLQRLFLACMATAVGLLGGEQAAFAQTPADGKRAPAALETAGVDLSTYRVGPEDVLEIAVWHEDALKKEALVRPDGGISYPLIGELQAAGKTVLEIREEIAKRLEKFIPDAVVSVTIVKIGSQRVYVVGKVNKPGEFPVGRYVDVLQALSMAGGLTSFADSNDIRIMRREGERQVALPFEYGRVVRGEKLEQNIQLRAGDVVVVP
jgi:polysaccharide export outer membrane protein